MKFRGYPLRVSDGSLVPATRLRASIHQVVTEQTCIKHSEKWGHWHSASCSCTWVEPLWIMAESNKYFIDPQCNLCILQLWRFIQWKNAILDFEHLKLNNFLLFFLIFMKSFVSDLGVNHEGLFLLILLISRFCKIIPITSNHVPTKTLW